jgi:hypothetical protein
MTSILPSVEDWMTALVRGQTRPLRKFVFDMVLGILVTGSPMLSEVARWLDEHDSAGRPRELLYTEKRLSRALNSANFDDAAFCDALLKRSSALVTRNRGADVVVAVDYTDISKPFARPFRPKGMELACVCHDGDKKSKGRGYPVVQIHASLPDGNHCPLWYDLFSYQATGFRSQAHEFLSRIKLVAPFVGAEARWAFDRGFDSPTFFTGLDVIGVRWVIRLKAGDGARHLRLMNHTRGTSVGEIAEATECPFPLEYRTEKGAPTELRVGAQRVLSEEPSRRVPNPPVRSLVVVRGFGEEPLALLTSDVVDGSIADVLRVPLAYLRRWKAEEGTRALKESRGWGPRLEDVRALKLLGLRRLLALAVAGHVLLAELRDRVPAAARALARRVRTFRDEPIDITYRMVRGIRDLFVHLPRWRRAKLRDVVVAAKRCFAGGAR